MKNTLLLILLFGTVLSLQSCNKELDALPKDSKVEKIVVLDQATAEIALNGVYYTFANASRNATNWLKHQVTPATLAGYMGYGFGVDAHEDNVNNALTDYWEESYKLINAANGFIQAVNALDDIKFKNGRKEEMLAESRFLRAYGHFKILSYYGQWFDLESSYGILIRNELSSTSSISKARSSVKDSYDFILDDLEYAIDHAPEQNEKFYITKWAAMVLKMRVLMSRGLPDDYKDVQNIADLVISGPYALENNPEDIFRSKGLSSVEVILGITPQINQELDFYSRSTYYWPGTDMLFIGKPTLLKLLENDPRMEWMLGSSTESDTGYPDTYYFTKYISEGSQPSRLSETDYAIRLTEVYLLKAEAIARSSGDLQEAKNIVHLIQSKVGITASENSLHYDEVEGASTPVDLLVEIYKETSRSLVAEDGMEWMALLRLPLETITELRPTLKTKIQYILPVPVSEFRYNPTFGEQNPGYSKN